MRGECDDRRALKNQVLKHNPSIQQQEFEDQVIHLQQCVADLVRIDELFDELQGALANIEVDR